MPRYRTSRNLTNGVMRSNFAEAARQLEYAHALAGNIGRGVRSSTDVIRQEALSRATSGQSFANYPAIIEGFIAKGIPAEDISPRENVFTYHAWKAKGRQVRKGEHGVRVATMVEMTKGEGEEAESFRRPWHSTVFHVSQTDPMDVK